ncbi:hypothetical protein FGO68_gene8627 [Halteria grandinella]|uniref:Uncharacterized protein n=1 Tax=Halteria grandinella TaxID=5974 RepID=A0A8J8T1G9_HALGN|nr:hypothetical protein FGO68_gene8627 [Halteria grandinella]
MLSQNHGQKTSKHSGHLTPFDAQTLAMHNFGSVMVQIQLDKKALPLSRDLKTQGIASVETFYTEEEKENDLDGSTFVDQQEFKDIDDSQEFRRVYCSPSKSRGSNLCDYSVFQQTLSREHRVDPRIKQLSKQMRLATGKLSEKMIAKTSIGEFSKDSHEIIVCTGGSDRVGVGQDRSLKTLVMEVENHSVGKDLLGKLFILDLDSRHITICLQDHNFAFFLEFINLDTFVQLFQQYIFNLQLNIIKKGIFLQFTPTTTDPPPLVQPEENTAIVIAPKLKRLIFIANTKAQNKNVKPLLPCEDPHRESLIRMLDEYKRNQSK